MDITTLLNKAVEAVPRLGGCTDEQIRRLLVEVSGEVAEQIPYILQQNRRDLDNMDPADPKYDRLLLTEERLRDMARDVIGVSRLDSPVGETLWENVRPNGMRIRKIAVPFGVVGVIYEARPNVTLDVFSLCFRTRNVCVLKGGSDARYTNEALAGCIHRTLAAAGLPEAVCTLLPPDRDATAQLLEAVGLVDVIIPRGSASLIRFVRDHARVPVIETGAGVCHAYVDATARTDWARAVVTNAKTRRVSVCNALDCLLIDRRAAGMLPEICRDLAARQVTVYADGPALEALDGNYPPELLRAACEEDYGREFLDYKMSIRTVSGIGEALEHIGRYGSKHSETIVSEDAKQIETFLHQVDAACVYANVSTAFTDGGQFGFGAEVGISTQKLHARGPMGLDALTTYKYCITGNGQVRS